MSGKKQFRCSICQRIVTEYGSNAQPVNSGICCTRCDEKIVMPARIRLMGHDDAADAMEDGQLAWPERKA